jgi:hypothetical protein
MRVIVSILSFRATVSDADCSAAERARESAFGERVKITGMFRQSSDSADYLAFTAGRPLSKFRHISDPELCGEMAMFFVFRLAPDYPRHGGLYFL